MIKAWSYSRYKTYTTCPRLAKYRYIDKLEEPEGEPLRRGSAIHKEGEDFLNGEMVDPPDSFKKFRRKLNKLREDGAVSEREYAFDKNWKPCGWFDKTTWARCKVDALLFSKTAPKTAPVAQVIDFKTGKVREEDAAQLELYALCVFLTEPTVKTVTSELWYLDQGEIIDAEFKHTEKDDMIALWESNVRPMLADKTFAARRNYTCKWCHHKPICPAWEK